MANTNSSSATARHKARLARINLEAVRRRGNHENVTTITSRHGTEIPTPT